MKLKRILGWSSALCLCATIAQAQETNQPADFDQRLIQMQEKFEQREREMEARFDKKTAAQDAEIEALKKQLAGTATNPPDPPAPVVTATPSTNTVTPEQLKDLNAKVDQVVEAQKKTLPGEFNPAIGLVGETVFSYRSKGSDATGSDRPGGFDVWQRSLELNASASVDPFAKGYAVINASADAATGEATLGVEEAALANDLVAGKSGIESRPVFRRIRAAGLHSRPRIAVRESSARARRIHRRRIAIGRLAIELAGADSALRQRDRGRRRSFRRRQSESRPSRNFSRVRRIEFLGPALDLL
jgi:hypothetical protein